MSPASSGQRGSAADRLASLSAPLELPGAREEIGRSVRKSSIRIAIIDDDPTGSQVVAGVPVIADWADTDIEWAIDTADTAFVVLTNSRSLDPPSARAINREIGRRLAERGRVHGVDIRCISRSDSTLRGHFPAEVDALIEGLELGDQRIDGVLLCPAFLQAGRLTIDDVHYVREDGELVPVADTEFAADTTFGYATSNLRGWAISRGVDPASITSLDLDALRIGGPSAVQEQLAAKTGRLIIANATEEADLDVLVLGVIAAERDGLRLVYRTAPSFVGARVGQQLTRPLSTGEIAPGDGPGLVVVGSHTGLTTRQLDHASREHSLELVELRVDRLDSTRDEIERCSAALNGALARGDAALVTSRRVIGPPDGDRHLDVGRLVADAIVEVVRAIPATQLLGWVVAKGGITSSDVATRALDARRAQVVGQIFPGLVSVWRLGAGSRRPGAPYVVFPGNVGDERALATTLARVKGL